MSLEGLAGRERAEMTVVWDKKGVCSQEGHRYEQLCTFVCLMS